MGSLTTPGQLEIARRHLDDAVSKGASVIAGGLDSGKQNRGGTLWAWPTILEGRSEDMDIYREETFGPLLPIVRVQDDDEAVRRANEEGFNLTTSVWSSDRARARAIAGRLRSGSVTINTHGEAAGVPWSPWGGIGESGYGRLNGVYGLRELTVATHVGTNAAPKLKRFFWYPYGEATGTAMRSLIGLLSAPTVGGKVGAFKSAAANLTKALKEKI
ncbi:MAG: aldehyde dehydrogenase family protein [Actinomycetota bacterium]